MGAAGENELLQKEIGFEELVFIPVAIPLRLIAGVLAYWMACQESSLLFYTLDIIYTWVVFTFTHAKAAVAVGGRGVPFRFSFEEESPSVTWLISL